MFGLCSPLGAAPLLPSWQSAADCSRFAAAGHTLGRASWVMDHMIWTAMTYMSSVERYNGWRQLCVHAQPCMQGSGDAAGLLGMLGAVYLYT
jgi:hypothetical protein